MSPNETESSVPEADRAPSIPGLMTVAEVCVVFRRKPRALRDWDTRGWLKPIRIGGNVFYRREDVLRLGQIGVPCKSRKEKA